jgi:tetratricopeptide (TPR) repeat protein
MLQDRYGLPLTTASAAAADAYIAGVDRVLAGDAGFEALFAQASEADPAFALPCVALARGLFVCGRVPAARAALAQARERVAKASPRERSHVEVLALPMEGKTPQALDATLAHLRQWPRDAMVLAPAAGVFGLYGFSGRPEREEQLYELLASLAPDYGEDWWFDAVCAFAACESGRLDEAWTRIQRSLDVQPRSPNSAHFKVHVLYEHGDLQAMLDYLDEWMPALDRDSLMHCHLSWHHAIAALGTDRRHRAWEIYEANVHPGAAWGPPINVATDSASFLWRAELAGQSTPLPFWREVHRHALDSFPKAGLAFADVHSLLACVAEGDAVMLERLLGEVRQRIAEQRYPAGDVVLRLAEGFSSFAAAEWNDAARHLERALPDVVRIGGSRAQRDLVELTLLASLLNADRPEQAQALVQRRGGLDAQVRHPPKRR